MSPRRLSSAAALMAISLVTVSVCSAQVVTSAHSGTLHYFDGDVSIDGAPVQAKVGRFAEIKEKSVLSTGLGRAEVLLTPGVFLRIGENSSISMLDNRLISTRVEVISGNAIVESDDPQMSIKNTPVTIIYKDYEIRLLKHGLVEIGTSPAQMKVYNGEAQVVGGDNRVTVSEGHLLPFSAALTAEKFNDKVGDDLYLWARDRSQTISAANMTSARTISTSGDCSGSSFVSNCGGVNGVNGGSVYGGWNGGWYYNPYMNMYTYVPGAGTIWSPFGYGFYSPYTIFSYYAPGTYWGGGGVGRQVTSLGGATLTTPVSRLNTTPTGLGSGVRSGGGLASSSPGGGSSGSLGGTRGSSGGGGAAHGGGGARGR